MIFASSPIDETDALLKVLELIEKMPVQQAYRVLNYCMGAVNEAEIKEQLAKSKSDWAGTTKQP